MIAYVHGTLTEREPTRVVIEAGGLGYEAIIPLSTYDRLPHVGEEVRLRTWHAVREDDETLFGFATEAERELFLKLVSVSGVGPKIAIAILSGGSVGELALSIAGGDAKRLAAVKGVGRKTAEKICVELKDKVDALAAAGRSGASAPAPAVGDAVAALRALGFNDETSAKMVTEVLAENEGLDDTEKIIRLALARR